MHRLVLAPLTAIGMTPPDFIALAAELGCEGVALNPGLFTGIDMGGPVYRLDSDPAMRLGLLTKNGSITVRVAISHKAIQTATSTKRPTSTFS